MIESAGMEHPLFSEELKAAGGRLHREVEETPFAAALGKGTVDEESYKNYLAALYVIYEQLEIQLFLPQKNDENGVAEILRPFTVVGLRRAGLIKQDLKAFGAEDRPPIKEAVAYKKHLVDLGKYRPHLLAAHAYLRFMGDLFGGQMIAKRLEERFFGKLAAYDFTLLCETFQIKRPVQYAQTLRAQIDSAPLAPLQRSEILEEVAKGYERHIALFKELESCTLSL